MTTNSLLKFSILILLFLGLTLPFHWVPSEPIVVPKKSLSFSKTFVSEKDVEAIVKQYYLGAPAEKYETDNDPLTQALKERWNVEKTEDGALIFSHLK